MRRSQLRLMTGVAALACCLLWSTSGWAASSGGKAPDVVSEYLLEHPGAREVTTPSVVSTAQPTPDDPCGPGSLPETTQGRAPLADFSNGRALKGYLCNAKQVSHTGTTGGYRVHRYTDVQGQTCAYFDTTQFTLATTVTNGEFGTVVVDMTNPTRPVQTARLVTPAFAFPHEAMNISQKRGLLMSAAGTNATGPGFVDIYSIKQDCRYPILESSTPYGLLGHESAVTADGLTFWVSSNTAGIIAAVDIVDPANPSLAFFSVGSYSIHGLGLSPDGRTLYGAGVGDFNGLLVLDVSDVQARKPLPQVKEISRLTWPEVSIPQTNLPITIKGRHYLVEVDEFAAGASTDPSAAVGAARVIDVEDARHPRVVSNLRLQVNQPSARLTDQVNDPQGNPLGGYAAHYCEVPRADDPILVACSFISSGLRIFNIADPEHPREVAYFNVPQARASEATAASTLSQPAFDLVHRSVWYAEGGRGMFDVQLTNGAWPEALTIPAPIRRPASPDQIAKIMGESTQSIAKATTGAYGLIYQIIKPS